MWKLSRDLMDQFRPAFLFLVLGAALLLTAVLAYQAQDAARSHRRTAEAVLQEYALLAAREFVRRVDSDLGYYGVTLALQQLSDGESLPDPAQVGDTRRRALNLVKTFFRWNLERGPPQVRPDLAGAQLSPEVLEGLRRHAGSFDQDWTYALYLPPSQEDLLIFYRPISSLPRTGIEGFIADSEAVTWHFQKVMDGSPLLPLSPGKGVENSQLSLSVIGPSQEVIFRTWRSYYSPVSVDHDFGAGLKDLRLTIELDPKAAGQLVIGGLPGSRMLLLLGLLTLNSGLIVAALVQLRRDREFSRRQADFIAAVSHELRTPLAQIQMFTDTLLLERVRSPQEARRSLEIVSQETRRLAHLVENVIQFSRSLRQHTMLEIQSIDPIPVLHELLEHFAPLAESSGCSIMVQDSSEPVRVAADPSAFRRVILNLLDNAVKYGPAGQSVRVTVAESSDNRVRIGIEDEGEGVPESQRETIWKRFERLERHRNAALAGTGIGLAVVRELLEAQQGKSWVEAGARGGALFVVELPISNLPPAVHEESS